ncbi:MAG: hypothetical protein IJO73_00495 [Clostridia bacterium]|nr:hypothetical protein [Clostridia bacterium]
MYITFKNNSTGAKMIVTVENQKHVINPECSVDIFFRSEKIEFIAETSALEELIDAVNEIDDNDGNDSFKERILKKFTKKTAEKLPDTVLNTSVKYEVTGADFSGIVINLYDGAYAICDGKIADFLDLVPIGYIFPRAETENGSIKVINVKTTNRKKYLKLIRNLLLFMHSGLTAINLLFFIPEYLIIKLLSSNFYIKNCLSWLYKKSADERESILFEKEHSYEKEEKKKILLPSGLKVVVVLVALCGLLIWGMASGPDVVISEDFSSVVCFEETFVKIDGGLPSDAEDVFLEDYTAFYPLADGEYDIDNYYCYIYETPDGTRYMWLKDNCTAEENADKEYEDYENPLVYKSVGEQE